MKSLLPLCVLALLAFSRLGAQDAVLRPGDQIEIRLGGVPGDEISQVSGQYQVDGQGFVNLPHIGKIKAAGVTQADLQNAIEGSYRSQQIYTNPTITVNIPAAARFVNVGGDVRTPRRVEFTPDLTILSAINAAGGFTDYADQKKVRLLRDGEVMTVNVTEIRRDPSKDVRLKPGDSIEVPQSFW
ncbi:MAG TPA: polysaccharide biosynthesis/export family protein [Terrimicrobiaceae bacterium]|nr:polysaccharide biosynthesis/export family protein [Terrimicrobiaceae bacterium]